MTGLHCLSERSQPWAGTGAPLLAAPSTCSLTGPHFSRIGRRYRQKLLTTVTELFDRENHCFRLDGRDAHSADRLANSHLVLVLRRDIAQNRNRVLSARIVSDADQFQVGQERLQVRGVHQRHKRVAATVTFVLKNLTVDQHPRRSISRWC